MRIKRTVVRRLLFTVALAGMMTFGGIQAQTTRHRVGAVCKDGTSSKATGSGAIRN